MKINTKQSLKDLENKEIKSPDGKVFILGQALSNILLDTKEGGKMKLYLLATKIYKNDFVEVDEADLILLKQAVRSSLIYNALVLGQCELLLENVKKEDK